MVFRPTVRASWAVIVASAYVVASATPAYAQQSAASGLSEVAFQAILACLASGREIVITSKSSCEPYGTGSSFAKNMPTGARDGTWRESCQRKDDPRNLPVDIVKRIIAQKSAVIAPTGIRIIGAVFCDGLDLVGVDLPYSLVFDRSIVNGELDARNLRVKGDLSFENAIILNKLLLNRAHVEGSVYGRWSFIEQLLVSDTQIDGTWWQSESVIFSDGRFHRTSFSGDLRLDGSAFTRLWILSSTLGGTLSLNNTEARCAYHLNSSSMSYLTASAAGFGRMQTAWPDGEPAVDYPWWDRASSITERPYTRQLLESAAVKGIVDLARRDATTSRTADPNLLRGCEATSHSSFLEFYLFDSTVRSAACVASFVWLAPKNPLPDDTHPVSILALNGTKVGGNLILDLWLGEPVTNKLSPGSDDYNRVASKHKFEAIGVSAGALIHNFKDNEEPYFTYIDGLNFDRIHDASPACAGDSGVQLASQVELPTVGEVMRWLNKNAALSSQPFAAFAAAFERAGESATDLRVQRQTYDLCEKTARWLSFVARLCPRLQLPDEPQVIASRDIVDAGQSGTAASVAASHDRGAFQAILGFFSAAGELVTIAFNWGLFALADHGLRPGKVVWWVLIALAAFAALFWFGLGVIGFEPKRKDGDVPVGPTPEIWPLSLLFLFDRLIPIYQIREEHYSINRFYRRATRNEVKTASVHRGGPPYPMPCFGLKFLVWPAADTNRRRIESWLVALRIIGVIFTVFLLAAINTLAR